MFCIFFLCIGKPLDGARFFNRKLRTRIYQEERHIKITYSRFVEDKTKIEEFPSKLSSSHEAFDIESLFRTSKESKISRHTVAPDIVSTSQDSGEARYKEAMCFSSFNSFSMGPVVKLPVESKVVMRLENTSRSGRSSGQPKKRPPEKDIISRIDQVFFI